MRGEIVGKCSSGWVEFSRSFFYERRGCNSVATVMRINHWSHWVIAVSAALLAACSSGQPSVNGSTPKETTPMTAVETVPNLTTPASTSLPVTSVPSVTDDVTGVQPRDGSTPGVRVWQLPDAPSGDRPDQSWLAIGSDPEGNIFVSGHDHVRNAMLYRLDVESGLLTWVGDARTASEAVDNWRLNETAEKFHTRPTYHDGRMYVATLDKSSIDDVFRATRGFHWYAYNLDDGSFVDLSVGEPDGVGAKQLQVVTIQSDMVNGRIYGITIPENKVLFYDVERGLTTVVGSPDEWSGYFYSNRFMWTDSRGALYLTGGTERSQWNQGEDRSVLDVVWKFDPESGFVRTEFALQALAAIEVGQWDASRERLYVSDDMGHVYRFTDATGEWDYLGRPEFPAGEGPSGFNKVWVFQLDPDEQTIYLGRSDNPGSPNEIWQFDIGTGESSLLASLPELDALAGSEAFITGYDSWDSNGSFYISAFSMYDSENAYLVGINPDQIRSSSSQ